MLGGIVLVLLSVAEVAYLLLLLVQAVRAGRRDPGRALLLAALAAFAIALRFLGAPRAPVVGAMADVTRIAGPVYWLDGGWNWVPGGYPPGLGVLLYGMFRLFGPSFDLAFGITTVIGGLVTIPAALLAERLGGRRAGFLAGVAAAVLPLSIVFSNGADMVMPAAFLVVASFHHGLAWAETRRIEDGLLLVLSLVIFAQMRPEGAVQAVLLVAALLVIVAGQGRLKAWWASPVTPPCVILGAALLVPYGGMTIASLGTFVSGMSTLRALLVDTALFTAVVIAIGVSWRWVGPVVASPAWRSRLLALVLLATVAALVAEVSDEGIGVLLPSFPDRLELPAGWNERVQEGAYFFRHQLVVLDPRMFPILWVAPWALSLLAGTRSGTGGERALAPVILVALVAMLSVTDATGEVIFEGFRLKVPAVGLLAASVGLGLSWPIDAVPRPARTIAAILAGCLALSPLATHRAVVADLAFNEQREFRFVVDSVGLLPEGALLLVPDQPTVDEVPGGTGTTPVWSTTRTDHFLGALGRIAGRPAAWQGVGAWRSRGGPVRWPAVFFHGVDCYRTNGLGETPDCRLVRTMGGTRTIAGMRIPNRPYTRHPMVDADDLDLLFLELSPEAVQRLRTPGAP